MLPVHGVKFLFFSRNIDQKKQLAEVKVAEAEAG